MAATVLNVLGPDTLSLKTKVFTLTIPTTVDGTDGATAIFSPGPARYITITATSSNFNSKALSVKASNDGVTFTALETAISISSSGNAAIDQIAKNCLGYRYYQLVFSGAPTVAVTVTIVVTLLGR